MRVWGAIVLAGCLVFASCGRFSTASSEKPTTSTGYSTQTLPPLATTTPLPAALQRATTPPRSATPTTRDRCAPPNQSTRDDPSGFRLIFTIAPRQCVKNTDDFTLQLEIQNITSHALQYDSNQRQFFNIYPQGDTNRPTWNDAQCQPRDFYPTQGGPITLSPGERVVRAQATYPGPKNQPNRDQCRILGGQHAAFAHLVTADGATVPSAGIDMTVS